LTWQFNATKPFKKTTRQEQTMDYWAIILIGVVGGVAVGLQGPLAGAMGQRVGGAASSFIIHLGGLLASAALLGLRGGENIKEWRSLPWYMLGAGVLGLVLFLTINLTLPRLGSTMMIALIIMGQLLIGIIIDHFGLLGVAPRPIDLYRLAGVAALLLGGYLISR
jgi:transporter family-2 protein